MIIVWSTPHKTDLAGSDPGNIWTQADSNFVIYDYGNASLDLEIQLGSLYNPVYIHPYDGALDLAIRLAEVITTGQTIMRRSLSQRAGSRRLL